jgi:predicted dehydrogenase
MLPAMENPMQPLTASVIGGGHGGRLSLDALAKSPHFRLVGAVDLRADVRAQLAQRHPGIRIFATHQELFAACPTDVVCVSTWAPSHAEVTRDALAMPLKAILVEKPLGDTYAAGREIIERVRAKGIPMAVPHGLLVRRCPLEVISRVRNGDIGELRLVEMQSPKWDMVNGIHWLHFMLHVAGNPAADSVLCACDTSSRTWRDGFQVETSSVTQVDLANGVRGILLTGDRLRANGERNNITFRLVGTRGQIEFWGWDSDYRIISPAHPGGTLVTPCEEDSTVHRRFLDALVPQVASGVCDYGMAMSSLAALELVEAAYLSARHHCQVRLPLADFVPPPAHDWHPGQVYAGSGGGIDGRTV